MNFTKRRLLIGSALFTLLACAGCNKSSGNSTAGSSPEAKPAESQKAVKLAFVTNSAGEFWKIAAAGVHKYEKEAKVQVDVKMPANGTTEEQNQILENLASQGYDAIAVSAIAPNDQVPVLNKIATKTKLLTFDSDAAKSTRLMYIGTNNYEAGKALGNEIVKLLPDGGSEPQALRITLAVAGFSADELEVALEDGDLTIRGKQRDEQSKDYLHRGIAARQFKRSFQLASGVEVRKAELDNGLLAIELVRPRMEKRVLKVGIAAAD